MTIGRPRRWLLLTVGILLLGACQPDPTRGHRPPAPQASVSSPTFRTRQATRQDVARSWRPGCPVSWTDLRVVSVTYWGYDGKAHHGDLVVRRTVTGQIREVFTALYRDRFQIERIHPVDRYGADDDRSMAANNTSAFNCRPVAGTSRWSEHASGTAIDVNPLQNPYVVRGTYSPPGGVAWANRADVVPGMATPNSSLVRSFDAVGWTWGGTWSSTKDYQHFSVSGH